MKPRIDSTNFISGLKTYTIEVRRQFGRIWAPRDATHCRAHASLVVYWFARVFVNDVDKVRTGELLPTVVSEDEFGVALDVGRLSSEDAGDVASELLRNGLVVELLHAHAALFVLCFGLDEDFLLPVPISIEVMITFNTMRY